MLPKPYIKREFWAEIDKSDVFFVHSFVEINFDRTPDKKKLFESSYVERSLQLLEIEENISTITKDTLLFFDEVQAAPEVFHFLRYLYEQRPDIPVIAAGSLLEFFNEK